MVLSKCLRVAAGADDPRGGDRDSESGCIDIELTYGDRRGYQCSNVYVLTVGGWWWLALEP